MEDLIKKVAQKADGQLDFGKIVGGIAGKLLELFDGKIIEGALTFGVTKIPAEYHKDLEIVLNAYLTGDYSKVQVETITRLNEAIDLPVLDEEEEAIILESIVGAFFKIVAKRTVKYQVTSVGGGGSGDDPTGGNG